MQMQQMLVTLTVGREDKPAGQSSTASGYTSGGLTSVAFSDVIDKFPFASDANATDVGDLTGGPSPNYGSTSLNRIITNAN